MDPRERALCAFRGNQPDRVPIFELAIDTPIIHKLAKILRIRANTKNHELGRQMSEMLETIKGSKYIELYCDVIEKLNLDAICYHFSIGLEKISQNKVKDKYGRVYNLSRYGAPLPAEPCVKSFSDAEKVDMVSKLESGDFSDLRRIVRKFGRNRAYFMPLPDPLKESWRFMGGMENLLLNFRVNPKLVHRLIRVTTDYVIKVVDIATDTGIDAFIMIGDYAYETGLLFSLKDYRRFLKPHHVEIVKYIHQKGAMVAKHSDGNIWPLLDEWMEMGFDGIHPIQPQCMDIRKVKEYVSGNMAVLGNIDCRDLLVSGSEKETRRVVKETIEKAAPGGGYILSSSNSIHPGCRPENYIAMVEAAHQFGAY